MTTLLGIGGLTAACAPDAEGLEGTIDAGTGAAFEAELATAEHIQSVREQIPGRDLQDLPPKIVSADLSSVNTTRDGNARLELRFGEALPTRLKFLFDGVLRELNDEGAAPDRAAGDGVNTAIVRAQQAELDEFERVRRGG